MDILEGLPKISKLLFFSHYIVKINLKASTAFFYKLPFHPFILYNEAQSTQNWYGLWDFVMTLLVSSVTILYI